MPSIARILPILLLVSGIALASPIVGRANAPDHPIGDATTARMNSNHQGTMSPATFNAVSDKKREQVDANANQSNQPFPLDPVQNAEFDAEDTGSNQRNQRQGASADVNAKEQEASPNPDPSMKDSLSLNPPSTTPGNNANVGERTGAPANEQVGVNDKSKDQSVAENESANTGSSQGPTNPNENAKVEGMKLTSPSIPAGESAQLGESTQRTGNDATLTEPKAKSVPENESATAKANGATPSAPGDENAEVDESESQGTPAADNESAKANVTPESQRQGPNENPNAKVGKNAPSVNPMMDLKLTPPSIPGESTQRTGNSVPSTPNEGATLTESNAKAPESVQAKANGATPSESQEIPAAEKENVSGSEPNGNRQGSATSTPNENAKLEANKSGGSKVNGSNERQGASPEEEAEVDTAGPTSHQGPTTAQNEKANPQADESAARKVNMGMISHLGQLLGGAENQAAKENKAAKQAETCICPPQ